MSSTKTMTSREISMHSKKNCEYSNDTWKWLWANFYCSRISAHSTLIYAPLSFIFHSLHFTTVSWKSEIYRKIYEIYRWSVRHAHTAFEIPSKHKTKQFRESSKYYMSDIRKRNERNDKQKKNNKTKDLHLNWLWRAINILGHAPNALMCCFT